MYEQRRELGSDERRWPHRILGGRRVVKTEASSDGIQLRVRYAPPEDLLDGDESAFEGEEEVLDADIVIAATGYRRNAHVEMLQDLWPLLPRKTEDTTSPVGMRNDRWEVQTKSPSASTRILEVARDYQVKFAPDSVAPGSGVWLQGCCEATHGVRLPFPGQLVWQAELTRSS